MLTINCPQCLNDFDCSPRKLRYSQKNGYTTFCSHSCATEFARKKVKCSCGYCGKEVLRTPSALSKSKTGNVYCNRSCATSANNSLLKQGESHPNYLKGHSSYRQVAFRNKEHKCECCGIGDPYVLEVHHKDENRSNNNLENLEILCANCHTRQHRLKQLGVVQW